MDAHYLFILGVLICTARYYFLLALNIRYQSNPHNLKQSNEVIQISEDHYQLCLRKSKKELRSSLFHNSYIIPAFLCFVGFGGLGWIESLAVSLVSPYTSSSLGEGIVFFCIIIAILILISIISNYYTTFIKSTDGAVAGSRNKVGFFKEYLGYVLISIVGVSLFLCCFYALVYLFPSSWLWVFFCSLVVILVATNILLPFVKFMNLKVIPLDQGSELRGLIAETCERVGFSGAEIKVVNKSIKSSHGGAYALGFIKKKVVFYDTLIEALAPREVVAILLHEIGHHKFRHNWWQLAVGLGIMMSVFALLSRYVVLPEVPMSFGLSPSKAYITLLMYLIFYVIIAPFANVGFAMVKRRQEWQADDYSYKMLPGSYLGDALVKIGVTLNQGLPFHHPLCCFIRHSHPTILERVRALRHKEHQCPA